MKIYKPQLVKNIKNKEFLTEGKECHIAEFFTILTESKNLFEVFNWEKHMGEKSS